MMSSNGYPTWERLMKEAYDFWNLPENKGKSYRWFLDHINTPQRRAVLLGNFNYQVNNGGFQQWVGNGYAQHGLEVVSILIQLRTMGATPTQCSVIGRLASKVERLLGYVNLDKESKGCMEDYWIREDPDKEEDYNNHPGVIMADEMSDWYYDVAGDVLMELAELYLVKLETPVVEPAAKTE